MKIIKDHLPTTDFLGKGVCYKQRPKDTIIDTLIIHSCYLSSLIINIPQLSPAENTTIKQALQLANRWLEGKQALMTTQIAGQQVDPASVNELESLEYLAIHTLIKARYGASDLQVFSCSAIKAIFEFYGVSAHYLIDRQGKVFEFVPPELLAFHAGKSRLPNPKDSRENVNLFSIGVELLGTEDSGFTDAQYLSLISLSKDLCLKFPLINFFGHCDIAPGRKTDPHNFDWSRFGAGLNLKTDKN